MKLRLLQVGKTQHDFIITGVELYQSRIRKYLPLEVETLPAVKMHGDASAQIKIREGETILRSIKSDDFLVLLDEKGKYPDSQGFAKFISDRQSEGQKRLTFVIGGAYGFSDAVYARADAKIALSAMTFSHQLVRLVFMEQVYRALTILNNHPYHHS